MNTSKPVWPSDEVRVYKSFFKLDELTPLVENAAQIASAPNFWTPKDHIVLHSSSDFSENTVVESIICILFDRIFHQLLPDDWQGAEWWVQVYDQGKGLAFHFDKDEHMFKEERIMVHPILSSIVYLTENTAEDIRLGPTVIIQQNFNNEIQQPVPPSPSSTVLVYPELGNLCVFDGALGHGVLDSFSKGKRMTLLVNWWKSQPQAVHRVTADDIATYKLATVQVETQRDNFDKDCYGEVAAKKLAIPVVNVPQDLDYALPVDDLLESAGLSPSKVPAVAIHHPGCQLYPLSLEDQPPGTMLATAAALLPASMIHASSGESSESEEH